MLHSGRVKAALGAVVALLAAGGIAIPGLLGDEPSPPPPAGPSQVQEPADPPNPSGEPEGSSAANLDSDEFSGIVATLAAIESGDPLPYSQDGQTFQNREGLLPPEPLGYYREYTVDTPGSPDRGARRLVIGEGGETYYTSDHYASFTRIDPKDFLE